MSDTPANVSLAAPPVAPAPGPITPVTGEKVRWGIIAPGHIAEKFAKAVTSLPDEAELVAVGSRSAERAADFAGRWGIPHSHGSYAELVARDDLDVVYVASPHNLHGEQAELAMRAGKHVLVEKPLSESLHSSRSIIETAADQGVFCMEAMWTRCNPLVMQARQLIADGALGDPRFMWCTFAFRFDGDDSHRLLDPELAGGAILDLGVYPMHAAHVLLGAPTGITAEGTEHPRTGVDATSVAHLTWDKPGGTTFGTLVSSIDARGDQRLSVFGTKGQLVLENFLAPLEMTFTPEGGEPQKFVTQDAGFLWQVQEVHRCLRAGKAESSAVPWQSSLDVAALLDQWRAGVGTGTVGR
ncbi:Gfo/Idh/MocA family protein [Aestuariimicrobium sp. T2.26MG-19.2B]|uniref:Gfo/Idh/MocA family protein n=1 Tax=Aestuariimicrobium sp. T2.26MG-19.2B TaxID=3040679 RepID=UPI00247773E1|nr:Gfo/Idh/MocA family oxidoreductase [Aestuariimicrobium sp. T2.26MG-19.2B]CAI9401079.1 scyllo-inositol 2-dehydrogenase (NADP(+)) IolU [Aestuariimicrobium sp. T2.26MG-19.2B]